MTLIGSPSLGSAMHTLKTKWGWIVALGVVYVVAGFIALGNELLSTFVSIAIIGAVMLVSGVFEIISAFQFKNWGSFLFWILMGALYAFAGALVFYSPLLAATAITLVIGVALIASGIIRVILAFNFPKDTPWILVALSGVITFLLGAIILMRWPVSSLYVLGLFLGIDLLFAGINWISVGLVARNTKASA